MPSDPFGERRLHGLTILKTECVLRTVVARLWFFRVVMIATAPCIRLVVPDQFFFKPWSAQWGRLSRRQLTPSCRTKRPFRLQWLAVEAAAERSAVYVITALPLSTDTLPSDGSP